MAIFLVGLAQSLSILLALAIFKQVHYPPPSSPNGDHIGKPNPPVQMRNDIWRSPLSLRWRLLLLLVSSLCIAAVEKAGENDENDKSDETSYKKRARDRCIRHLWRTACPSLPAPPSFQVGLCAHPKSSLSSPPHPLLYNCGACGGTGREQRRAPHCRHSTPGQTFHAALKGRPTITGA